MTGNRRIVVLLVVLGAALALLAWQRLSARDPGAGLAAAGSPGAPAAARTAGVPTIPDVALERLEAPGAGPVVATRNLFRFQVKAAPVPAFSAPRPAAPVAGEGTGGQAGPPPPPPPPPITLKLIGIVEGTLGGVKLAVLTDSRSGDTFFGAEGDVIDGRYRLVRIGVESVEMTHADGRGRQTIRLSGQ